MKAWKEDMETKAMWHSWSTKSGAVKMLRPGWVWWYVCNPSTWKAKTGRFLEFEASLRYIAKLLSQKKRYKASQGLGGCGQVKRIFHPY